MATRAATDEAVRAVVQPLCGALTRYGGYGAAARDALVAVSAGSINATPLPTKVGFLRGLKDHDQYRVLGTITAQTTVISGGADKLIPPAHAHELVAAIPGARHLHHPPCRAHAAARGPGRGERGPRRRYRCVGDGELGPGPLRAAVWRLRSGASTESSTCRR
ncbi:hypothetical protein C1Y40_00572 [Mycobacterium talmoniae]|uniref:Uncharacterized protein n=1 Tax=Mycobacterium talmoniae TaxID=1858794 RepID=A0A2S8BRF2_9MYCO|nr:hypothetical protein C1Y40_00572 [Mycobacterium talmoniae]